MARNEPDSHVSKKELAGLFLVAALGLGVLIGPAACVAATKHDEWASIRDPFIRAGQVTKDIYTPYVYTVFGAIPLVIIGGAFFSRLEL